MHMDILKILEADGTDQMVSMLLRKKLEKQAYNGNR